MHPSDQDRSDWEQKNPSGCLQTDRKQSVSNSSTAPNTPIWSTPFDQFLYLKINKINHKESGEKPQSASWALHAATQLNPRQQVMHQDCSLGYSFCCSVPWMGFLQQHLSSLCNYCQHWEPFCLIITSKNMKKTTSRALTLSLSSAYLQKTQILVACRSVFEF